MRNRFKKFIFLLLYSNIVSILLINSVMANTISLVHGEGNIEILDWREENTIKNLDLFSEIVLELKITKNLDNASLTFDAGISTILCPAIDALRTLVKKSEIGSVILFCF